ncbi:hypothetical protein M378DRAFT_120766 [Amanita muscaria Koide BX008]|uniref:Hamartin n=1 Tax=Amanita muscaria (strain Koide BX008) TaxID=946122 RepID=A0A0C2XGL2_AMAMK|nr:hypothetical protein M378DRAFT_120766 [Amanita muscaria Koide BX008]
MLDLIRDVRSALESAPDAPTLSEIARATEEHVAECSSFPDFDNLILSLEEELQAVHRDIVDYSLPYQLEVFLVVLSHLKSYLSLSSMFYWWDIVLRPALREPKLGTVAVDQAKELVLDTLRKTEANLHHDFRRRLFDLYLLDTYNEGSDHDVLEHAELDADQRDMRTCWKVNLENILLKFGHEYPQDFMTEVHDLFTSPSSRFQLFMLLNIYSSSSSFATSAIIMAKHPLMIHLLLSMLFDNSSTVYSAGLSVVVKLLPVLAAHAHEELRALLPMLLTVLAGLMCWKQRHTTYVQTSLDGAPNTGIQSELEEEANPVLRPHPQWNWERLERTFNLRTPVCPSPRPYFTILYYLYPAKLLKFLRSPVKYLTDDGFPSPWTEGWEQALNQDEIRACSERLLREHMCHPAFLWHDAGSQPEGAEFWAQFPVDRIATEAIMLDVHNYALGALKCRPEAAQGNSSKSNAASVADNSDANEPIHRVLPLDKSSGSLSMSLPAMVNSSFALKSNLNLVAEESASKSHQSNPPSSSLPPSMDAGEAREIFDEGNDISVPPQYLQAVARLQSEVLLLRNELNFELWLSRENVKHISRLFLDRSSIKSAEAERQGLYNKLRKYRAQVVLLESELHEYKAQASSAKNKYAEWNMELQKKLKELREEKKSWVADSAALRRAKNDYKTLLDSQEKLLEEANKKLFESETWRKENQHKIDRLHDYEEQISKHIRMQQLWEQDFARFNERGEQVSMIQSHFKQMELRLESYEKTQIEMDAQTRAYRRQIQTLEARLSQMRRKTESLRYPIEQEIASVAAEKATLIKANQKLREENVRLREEIDELRAVVEVNINMQVGRTE